MVRKVKPIKIEGDIAYVPLTQGHVAIVDACNVHIVNSWNWHAVKSLNTVYARRTDRSCGFPVNVYMHRVILGDPDKFCIDHIDSNGLNNLTSNIRKVEHYQNIINSRFRADNSSGFRGVSFDKSKGKWVARITTKGRVLNIGRFASAEDAALAYEKKSLELHKEFRRLSNA